MKMHYVEQTNWVIVSLGPSIILLLYTDYLVQFLFKSGIDLSEPVNQTSSETEPSFWSYQVKPPKEKFTQNTLKYLLHFWVVVFTIVLVEYKEKFWRQNIPLLYFVV